MRGAARGWRCASARTSGRDRRDVRAPHGQHTSSASAYVSAQYTGRGSSWRCTAVWRRGGKRWQFPAYDPYAEEDDDEVVGGEWAATMGVY